MDFESATDLNLSEKYTCLQLFTKFTKEVLIRMQQYKEDLLASCLTFILALPKEIVSRELGQIIPAIQMTFKLGLSYLPLASAGLDTLEHWVLHLDPQMLSPYYKDILPSLDDYLRTSANDDVATVDTVTTMTSTTKHGRVHRLPLKLLAKAKEATAISTKESQLENLKLRIVSFLGSLGGKNNAYLVGHKSSEIAKIAVAWDTHQHLKFPMPFMDVKATMYLDPFLPRVIELATVSSNRQTKVAACELLHSIVLYTLGRSIQKPEKEQEKFPLTKLYKNIFPALLKLATDVELVTKQLFEPLVIQLIHWFTHSKMAQTEETMVLLEAIFDGIIHPTDTALRDFSARCTKEFLKWSIKQTTKASQGKNPHNMKSMLKRIYSLALHPSPFKRLGASLAFNSIYTIFREEESLVNIFVFEILMNFIDSLAIAHHDESSLGTQQQCREAINHLERIIQGKANLLSKDFKDRRIPREWDKANLQICIRRLLRQCGRPQTECRHACMELICKLVPSLPDCKSPVDYFKKALESNKSVYFVTRFELYRATPRGGLSHNKTMNSMGDSFTLKIAHAWYDMVLATLDCYTWVFGQGLLKPLDLLEGTDTVLFKVIEFFVKSLSLGDISTAASLFTTQSEEVFTPKEVEDYNRAKCTVIVRAIDFLMVLLASSGKDVEKVVPVSFWSNELWDMVCNCVLRPATLGFNMADFEVMMQLPKETEQLLKAFTNSLPGPASKGLKKHVAKIISNDGSFHLFTHLTSTFSEIAPDVIQLQHLAGGYDILWRTGYLADNIDSSTKMAEDIYNSVVKWTMNDVDNGAMVQEVEPSTIALAKTLLPLSFKMGLSDQVLLNAIFDKKKQTGKVKPGNNNSSGSIFYTRFSQDLNKHIVDKNDTIIPSMLSHSARDMDTVSRILISLLDQIGKDRKLRKADGPRLVTTIVKQWSQLDTWKDSSLESKQSLCIVLRKILLIDSKVALSLDGAILKTYCTMLRDKSTSLSIKAQTLDLLPFFTASTEDHEILELKNSLNDMVGAHFPMKSTECTEGSPLYNDYVTAFTKLLTALELSGSVMLLDIMISITCRPSEDRHLLEDDIQHSLATFVKRLPKDQQKPMLDVAYTVFTTDSYPCLTRRSAIERICIPMLHSVHSSALIEFLSSHIKEIITIIEEKQSKASESVLEKQIIRKMSCYQLIEIMYCRLPKNDVHTANSLINRAYCDNKSGLKGNETTAAVVKAASAAKNEDMRGETLLVELRRQLHCSVYNCLMSVISCTQEAEKFYKTYLFNEDPSKGQLPLDNIIDLDRTYTFEVELSALPARKKRFVAIRHEARENLRENDDDYDPSQDYLASQYLADSSLSADVSQYDFTSSSVSSLTQGSQDGGQRSRRRRPDTTGDLEDPSVRVQEDSITMEMDELNSHECIAAMTALIQHMHRNKITPHVEPGSAPGSLPSWMKFLHDKLSSPAVHLNIKLFITKLIINTEEVFRPYCKFWLSPLTQLVISGCTGPGLNYFVVDVLVTMLAWASAATPEDNTIDRPLATRLAEYIMDNVHHANKQVLKNNLELLKTLVECWKDKFDVPTRILFDGLTRSNDPKSKDNATGIQILGVVLVNKLPPYSHCPGVSKSGLYEVLAKNINNASKPVYSSAAEVIGMALTYLAESDPNFKEEYMSYIGQGVISLYQTKPDCFITCVYKMHLHHPAVADQFINKMLFILPKLHGEFKVNCMEVIQSRVGTIDNVYIELKNKGLTSWLSHRDESIQVVALKIVKAMLVKLQCSEVLQIMSMITAFGNHPSVECRTIMYDILMWLYDCYRTDDSEDSHQILAAAKDTLLLGLSDENMKNRLTVQNFWSHESRLPGTTVDRVVSILHAMYSPSTESQYLSYATNFILEMTSKSPDFNREIFEHPLSDCKFEDINITSSWKHRHAAMTPMFVDTQVSSQSQRSSSGSLDDTMGSAQLRETQDVKQFTATQVGSKGPYNWLTQSSLDTFNDAFTIGTATSETQSSMMFTVGHAPRKRAQQNRANFGVGFVGGKKTGRDEVDSGASVDQSQEVLRLKKHFLKDTSKQSIFFARRQLRRNKMREEAVKEQKVRRENQVTMYRKYRMGDLPDIQIKYSYLISPLQALAQRDPTLAQMLFSSLFCAIFAEIDNIKTEKEVNETLDQISKSMNSMLETSDKYYAPFIGSVLDIAYQMPKKVKLDPSLVQTAALTSMHQSMGIILLEETLIRWEEEDRGRSKRMKFERTITSDETNTWIELARLYKSLEDYDVLGGIFSSKIGTQEITSRALEAESRGDFETAARLYNDALTSESSDEDRPLDMELDLWDDSLLHCYNHLTKWDDLEKAVTEQIDESDSPNLNKLWESTYYQEHYLPFLLRSKLKLLIHGDEKQQSLLSFIDEAMKVQERKALLEGRYSEQLALLYLFQEDYDRADYYASNALGTFMQEWSSIDTLMEEIRSSHLQQLQKMTELKEFLDFIRKEENFTSERPYQLVIDRWTKRMPDSLTDPVSIWDDIVQNRCLYMSHIAFKMQGITEEAGEIADNLGKKQEVVMRLAEAGSAIEQLNFYVTKRLLNRYKKSVKKLEDEELQIQFYHIYAKTVQRNAVSSNSQTKSKISGLLSSYKELENLSSCKLFRNERSLLIHHHTLQSTNIDTLLTILLQDKDSSNYGDETVGTLLTLSDVKTWDNTKVVTSLIEKGHSYVKKAEGIASSRGGKCSTVCMSEAYMAITKYCDKYLRLMEDGEVTLGPAMLKTFPLTISSSLLKGMKLDCMEARQRFPRLLQLIEHYPEIKKPFIGEVSQVPCWMFICWIGQMVAILDKPEGDSVHSVLEDIAKHYPQALIYPFKVTSEGYKWNAKLAKNKAFVDQLEETLSKLSNVNVLISALMQFEQPNQMLKDWAMEFKSMLHQKSKQDSKAILTGYNEIFEKLFAASARSSRGDTQSLYDSSLPDSIPMGLFRKKIAQKISSKIEKFFGKKGERLVGMKPADFGKAINEICELMGDCSPPGTVKEYCEWMATYNSMDYDKNLEIPGQYDGMSKPLPDYHVMIAGFGSEVKVMTSLRKPKRITIRGSDEKEYKFLVKGGEDLRQDQRIEQLFSIMNDIFRTDPKCNLRHYSLRTYQVVPMTTRVGLIEWMDNTTTLKLFLEDALTPHDRKSYYSAGDVYENHTGRRSKQYPDLGKLYGHLYQSKSKTQTQKALFDTQNKVPWDLFRRAYISLSASPAAFFTLRSHFAVTHAVICISNYILGIGDRHLSNFMIDLETGGMIGIDFGHAFGSATQFLGVPELVPFRLTRQLTNLLMPHKEKGLLQSTMVHALRAIRNNHDLLLNTMDVFIKDQSIDWVQNAEKEKARMSGEDKVEIAEKGQDWYPREKVNYAKRKMQGANPWCITRDELKLGHSHVAAFNAFVSVAKGDTKDNIRASLSETDLTPEDQVACLIDQATDPNILGRTYKGWEPWM